MAAKNPKGTSTRSTDLTTFKVKVEGKPLPGSYGIISLVITQEINRVPQAAIVLYDGDAARQDFEISTAELLVPGAKLEIEAGYSSQEQLLFRGVITGQQIKVRRRGNSTLHVQVRDPAFRMTLDRKSAYFIETKDSDLFETIIGRYEGLTPKVQSTSVSHPHIVQYQVTDWDFIVSRAERIGMFCTLQNGDFHIKAPDPNQKKVHTLSYGLNVVDIDLELDSRSQVQKVTSSAWDYGNQEVILSEIDNVSAPAHGNLAGSDLAKVGAINNMALRHSGSLSQQEVDSWAEAEMLKSRFSKIRGTIRFQGTEVVKPGYLVELKGMGDRFNGTAFVSGVRHELGGGDWETSIQLGYRREWHHQTFPIDACHASGYSPAIHGLQIGVVTQLENDPQGEDRVLVRLPMISNEEEGVWSRIATLDAGENRGSFFRPELGDEVVVGFINEDPHQSVLLGMLNSSKKPAPIKASDDNHEKGFVTRSGMKVIFNDDTPSITIETPNGNKLAIDDGEGSMLFSDENGNTVTLASEGINLKSAKDIVLKADGSVTVEGQNVEVNASAAAKLEGSGGATLKSGGTTEVKGSVVMLN